MPYFIDYFESLNKGDNTYTYSYLKQSRKLSKHVKFSIDENTNIINNNNNNNNSKN